MLRCTKCFNETPLTNFQVIQPIKAEQREPSKRLSLGVATTGVGYRSIKAIMATLSLSIQSERTFLPQLNKYYDGSHNFAQQDFKTIIKNITSRNNSRQNIMSITVSIDITWKQRDHVSNYGIVYINDVQSGLCIDYEVISLLCEACYFKKPKLS